MGTENTIEGQSVVEPTSEPKYYGLSTENPLVEAQIRLGHRLSENVAIPSVLKAREYRQTFRDPVIAGVAVAPLAVGLMRGIESLATYHDLPGSLEWIALGAAGVGGMLALIRRYSHLNPNP